MSEGSPAVVGEAPDGRLIRWVFLRFLGVAYLSAFLSLWSQVLGLIGSQGILPIGTFLLRVEQQIGTVRFWLLPTLCWINSSDSFLSGLCAVGALFSCALIVGLAPPLTAFLLWVLYLSLTTAGQVFLGYQWDSLLLETGLLAVFLAPWGLFPRPAGEAPPSPLVLWLFRFLLFRLMFSSGAVKLLSGDRSWKGLTALCVHYETQPLPTWVGWYLHQMPRLFQRASTLMALVMELGVPWLIFAPRRGRLTGCVALILLQVLIAVTGNYAFFNLLTIGLCLLLLDDRVVPVSWRERFLKERSSREPPRVVPFLASALLLPLSAVPFLGSLGLGGLVPAPLAAAHGLAEPFRSINSYGLFAVMTTSRPEIIIEGSQDGETWKAYEFRFKPGDPARAPAFVAPHQPRLDWQMWFAALAEPQDSPWFFAFLVKLLDGSPSVLALLARDPFPGAPPRYIRAELFDYRFTDWKMRQKEGTWWRRRLISAYGPELARKESRAP